MASWQKTALTEKKEPQQAVAKRAEAIQTVFLITTLGSKLHEAGEFLRKEEVTDNIPRSLYGLRTDVDNYDGDQKIAGILQFIRNKFGFHYDTYDDLDPKIDAAFTGLPEVVMYLFRR